MVEMSEDQLIDLWDIFSEHVPKQVKEQLSLQFIKWAQDNGVDEDVLYALGSEDPYLEEAVEELQGKRHDPEDDDWNDDPYSSDNEDWD